MESQGEVVPREKQSTKDQGSSVVSPSSPLFYLLAHHVRSECASHCLALSIPFKRKTLYLCSRCTGLFLGVIFLHILSSLWSVPFDGLQKLVLAVFLGLPTMIDWTLSKLDFLPSTSYRRFFTAFAAGNSITLIGTIEEGLYWYLGMAIIFTMLLLVYLIKIKKAT